MEDWTMTRTGLLGVAAAALFTGNGAWAMAGTRPGAEASPVAVVGGVAIGPAQLDDLARGQLAPLRTQEYEIKRKVLDQHVEKLLLEQEAAARNVPRRCVHSSAIRKR